MPTLCEQLGAINDLYDGEDKMTAYINTLTDEQKELWIDLHLLSGDDPCGEGHLLSGDDVCGEGMSFYYDDADVNRLIQLRRTLRGLGYKIKEWEQRKYKNCRLKYECIRTDVPYDLFNETAELTKQFITTTFHSIHLKHNEEDEDEDGEVISDSESDDESEKESEDPSD